MGAVKLLAKPFGDLGDLAQTLEELSRCGDEGAGEAERVSTWRPPASARRSIVGGGNTVGVRVWGGSD